MRCTLPPVARTCKSRSPSLAGVQSFITEDQTDPVSDTETPAFSSHLGNGDFMFSCYLIYLNCQPCGRLTDTLSLRSSSVSLPLSLTPLPPFIFLFLFSFRHLVYEGSILNPRQENETLFMIYTL